MTNNDNINNVNDKLQGQSMLYSSASSSSSSVRREEDTMMQKQGIITILDSNANTISSASSLRRTLSADMSSKNWLSQTIAPSQELLHAKTIGDSEDDESNNKELDDEAERERLEIWSSIQRNKKEEQEKSASFDTWSSIISLKGKDEISKSLPASPYVHPLVKRSKSCLSEKSLQICTESLGSETGSDGLLFSSYSSSETGDAEEEEKVVEPTIQEEEEEEEMNNYASVVATKKALPPTRAFPPPLPSLHMRSRRDNGRLVLEAVSVPSHNNFSIQRQGGRLVLSFSNHQEEEEEEEENDGSPEQEYLGRLEIEEEEYSFGTKSRVSSTGFNSGFMEYESVMEKGRLLSGGVTTSSVQGLALMMNNKNKPIGAVNRNPKWSEKFSEMTNFNDVNAAQSLPPRPRVARLIPSAPAVAAAAAAASLNLNAYEYYWRTNSAPSKGTSVKLDPLDQNKKHHPNHQENTKNKVVVSRDMNKMVPREQQQVLVLRGKNGDYLVHNLKSCKDSRRSFLFWEPYCIATS
ncbi:protein FAF-like, chloroplastic [Vigna unguiculata]|uniref:The fantastic four family n=1 Tax=Vigna unguiculata TaxID=3917 RepID=A0A4D6LHG8_VIGUN|nr:protein FAF-like, chloroplastic [Vigna unguiculata]QCD87980.1 The fantastic four family [Vigna unguiculata]